MTFLLAASEGLLYDRCDARERDLPESPFARQEVRGTLLSVPRL